MPTYHPTCRSHLPNDPTPCSGKAVVLVMLNATAGNKSCEAHAVELLRTTPQMWPIGLPETPSSTVLRIFKAGRS